LEKVFAETSCEICRRYIVTQYAAVLSVKKMMLRRIVADRKNNALEFRGIQGKRRSVFGFEIGPELTKVFDIP
jgi:hypothetical protein